MVDTGRGEGARSWPGWARWAAWLVGLVGIASATWRYLQAETFFIDEVKLLWNVADRDWSNLFEPLGNNQVAAVGFLVLEKSVVSIFGVSELSTRLVPLLSMLLAVGLFVSIVKRVVSPVAGILAVILFAWAAPLIYYASQSKQYTLDVLMAELVLLAALLVLEDLSNRRRWIALVLAAVLAVVMSIPAVIVLAGVTSTLIVVTWRAGRRDQVAAALGLGLAWSVTFGALYLWKYRFEGDSDYMATYWTIGFLPPPWQPIALARSIVSFGDRLMREVAGIHFRAAGLVAYLIGIAALWRRLRAVGLLMVLTMAIAVVLSSLHLYPLKERAALYLLPFLVIPIAAVWDELGRDRQGFSRVAAVILLGVILVGTITGLGRVETRADIKPVMERLLQETEADDVVYIYWRPQRVIDFYDRWKLGPDLLGDPRLMLVRGEAHIEDPLAYIDAVNRLADSAQGDRVWFLYSRRYAEKGLDEVEILRRAFDRRGRLVSEIETTDAGAWLYEMSTGP